MQATLACLRSTLLRSMSVRLEFIELGRYDFTFWLSGLDLRNLCSPECSDEEKTCDDVQL